MITAFLCFLSLSIGSCIGFILAALVIAGSSKTLPFPGPVSCNEPLEALMQLYKSASPHKYRTKGEPRKPQKELSEALDNAKVIIDRFYTVKEKI